MLPSSQWHPLICLRWVQSGLLAISGRWLKFLCAVDEFLRMSGV